MTAVGWLAAGVDLGLVIGWLTRWAAARTANRDRPAGSEHLS